VPHIDAAQGVRPGRARRHHREFERACARC